MEQTAILQVEQVSKRFPGSPTPACDRISLTLQPGELLGLLGPSGCGKTTLLRIIAGFEQPNTGAVTINGRTVADVNCWVPPEQRHTGMVFQDFALFPHLSAAENVAFGLRHHRKRLAKSAIAKRVLEVLALVGLADLKDRYPHQLSGGQQQRIALARALAPEPALILLDEPLSNLDVQVRQRLRDEVRRILKSTQTPAIFVTHDQEEALAIADQIGVMCCGHLEQLGQPEKIYQRPASRFVAEFVMGANFLAAQRQGDLWRTEIGAWEIDGIDGDRAPHTGKANRGELMLPQEAITLVSDPNSAVTIVEKQFLGREYRYSLLTPSQKLLLARTPTVTCLDVGTRVTLKIAADCLQVFPLPTGCATHLDDGHSESMEIKPGFRTDTAHKQTF